MLFKYYHNLFLNNIFLLFIINFLSEEKISIKNQAQFPESRSHFLAYSLFPEFRKAPFFKSII